MWGELISTDTGQVVVVHPTHGCLPPCPVRGPSAHSLNTRPLHWRGDRRIMERICTHVVGHPDPDDLGIRLSRDDGTHGCDGCCVRTSEEGSVT